MKAVIALLLGVAYALPAWKEDTHNHWDQVDHVTAWNDWKANFGKEYNDLQEESFRFLQFLSNWEFIDEHNKAGFNYTMGMNQFSDLSVEEFEYSVHGSNGGCLKKGKPSPTFRYDPKPSTLNHLNANPAAVDWTNVDGKSYVTPVKNQGQCGSCWAFSTTGSLESRYAIAHQQTGNAITTLSEQELVDCSGAEGNEGCNGGLMDDAFKYVEKEGGLCSEAEYKYTARDGTCKKTSCGTHYDSISTYTDVKSDSEPDLETAVVAGPVSVAVDAAGTTWQFYKTGIVDGHCGVLLDHGVLAVGYGADTKGEKYWKVKNSWGVTWGMQGYILLCKDCDKNAGAGECGIARQPSFPVPK